MDKGFLGSVSKKILMELFSNQVLSRKNIALQMGVTQAAISQGSKVLVDNGFMLDEGYLTEGRVGRKEQAVRLNPRKYYLLGIEVMKKTFSLTLTDFTGNPIFQLAFDSLEDLFPQIGKIQSMYSPILSPVVVVTDGYLNEDEFALAEPTLHRMLVSMLGNPLFINDVICLGDIISVKYAGTDNFLIVKMGPTLQSALFMNGAPLKNKKDHYAHIEDALHDGKPIKEILNYLNLLGKNYEEEAGAKVILEDDKLLEEITDILATSLNQALSFMAFDALVPAGALLTNPKVLTMLHQKIEAINPDFDFSMVYPYPSYQQNNTYKASIEAFINAFGKN